MSVSIGNLSNEIWKSEVFRFKTPPDGYALSVCGLAITDCTVKVYESCGGVGGGLPDVDNAYEWALVFQGTASDTEAFMCNRENFRGPYMHVVIDVSAGSINSATLNLSKY